MQKSGLQHGQGGRAERLQGVWKGRGRLPTSRLYDEAAARLRLRRLGFGGRFGHFNLLYRVAARMEAASVSPHIPARRICALHNEIICPCPSVK